MRKKVVIFGDIMLRLAPPEFFRFSQDNSLDVVYGGGESNMAVSLVHFPYSSIMPTGGVSPDEANLKGWFDAGVHCIGMGSQLFPKKVLYTRDFNAIAAKCSDALATVE